jgi:glycine cleavage system H protein
MMNPSDLKYSKEHEWVRLEDNNEAIIGITDYAQEQLGDVVYLLLPSVGDVIEKDKRLGEVESVKSVSDLFCPVSGEVIEVNEEVKNQPELANEDPYGKGWMVRLRLSDPGELDSLMSAQQYEEMIAQED